MLELTKLNNEKILINPFQVEFIEAIPESKIVMMNGKFHLVSEDYDEIQRQFLQTVTGLLHSPQKEEE